MYITFSQVCPYAETQAFQMWNKPLRSIFGPYTWSSVMKFNQVKAGGDSVKAIHSFFQVTVRQRSVDSNAHEVKGSVLPWGPI